MILGPGYEQKRQQRTTLCILHLVTAFAPQRTTILSLSIQGSVCGAFCQDPGSQGVTHSSHRDRVSHLQDPREIPRYRDSVRYRGPRLKGTPTQTYFVNVIIFLPTVTSHKHTFDCNVKSFPQQPSTGIGNGHIKQFCLIGTNSSGPKIFLPPH